MTFSGILAGNERRSDRTIKAANEAAIATGSVHGEDREKMAH
jgi:hypothetical protein